MAATNKRLFGRVWMSFCHPSMVLPFLPGKVSAVAVIHDQNSPMDENKSIERNPASP
jgi:hypothetical protein